MMSPWFKNAIFYALDTETFYDADGDGAGDFTGLIERLDYIASLGVTCIWLQPFFPSPDRDNRYDVMEYCNVDPRLGTLGAFAELMDKADQYGIRVIIDLVVNHTSIEHPWFREARNSPSSCYRDYYIWVDKPQPFGEEELVLKGEESTVWTYDQAAGQYYLHHFHKEQPDLNIANPAVREEILRIMGFWLRLGVAGFRIDGVQFLMNGYGSAANKESLSNFLNDMRDFISMHSHTAILLGETNLEPQELTAYVDHKRMHMGFNFYVNQHLFLALAKEAADPLYKALSAMPAIEPYSQMLNFLRHHDELSLKLLDEQQRSAIFERFGSQEEMRIYGSGIRRRLAPLMQGNRQHIELAYSLMFSLPACP